MSLFRVLGIGGSMYEIMSSQGELNSDQRLCYWPLVKAVRRGTLIFKHAINSIIVEKRICLCEKRCLLYG